jgi:hypothetical protein
MATEGSRADERSERRYGRGRCPLSPSTTQPSNRRSHQRSSTSSESVDLARVRRQGRGLHLAGCVPGVCAFRSYRIRSTPKIDSYSTTDVGPEVRPTNINFHVNRRAVFGHWEGDTIVGKWHKTGIHTEVERVSRLLSAQIIPSLKAKHTFLRNYVSSTLFQDKPGSQQHWITALKTTNMRLSKRNLPCKHISPIRIAPR